MGHLMSAAFSVHREPGPSTEKANRYVALETNFYETNGSSSDISESLNWLLNSNFKFSRCGSPRPFASELFF
jgi:hypothetical protein